MQAPVVTIRTATADDISAVDRLLSQSYPRLLKGSYPPSIRVTALPLISRANPSLVTCGTYYVAEADEGGIVGAGGWTPRAKGSGRGDVRHVVTDYREVRRGIARSLMATVFDEARDVGIGSLECLSTRMAVPFYEAVGFSIEAPATISLRPGIVIPVIRMSRRL